MRAAVARVPIPAAGGGFRNRGDCAGGRPATALQGANGETGLQGAWTTARGGGRVRLCCTQAHPGAPPVPCRGQRLRTNAKDLVLRHVPASPSGAWVLVPRASPPGHRAADLTGRGRHGAGGSFQQQQCWKEGSEHARGHLLPRAATSSVLRGPKGRGRARHTLTRLAGAGRASNLAAAPARSAALGSEMNTGSWDPRLS